MVLGIIEHENGVHGYKVYQELRSWQTEKWSKVRPGSIYHALSQLEKEAFIQNSGTTKNQGPARTHYRITETGKAKFLRLVQDALTEYDPELFTAGVAFMHVLPRSLVVESSKKRLKAYQDVCSFLQTLPQEQSPTTPAKHPEIIGTWLHFFRSTAAWQEGFIGRLEEGQYIFSDEGKTSLRSYYAPA